MWTNGDLSTLKKGNKVRIANYEKYHNAKQYGEVYQIMSETVVVLFGVVGVNISKEDIRLIYGEESQWC